MKLFLVSLAVCIGATSAQSSIAQCSPKAQSVFKGLEVAYFSQEPGTHNIHYVTKHHYDSPPPFDSAKIEVGPPDKKNVTRLLFLRFQKGVEVKRTELKIYETSNERKPYSEINYPLPTDKNNIINLRCGASRPVIMSYTCTPGQGDNGNPFFTFWSSSEKLKDEDFKPCFKLANEMYPELKFVQLKTQGTT